MEKIIYCFFYLGPSGIENITPNRETTAAIPNPARAYPVPSKSVVPNRTPDIAAQIIQVKSNPMNILCTIVTSMLQVYLWINNYFANTLP
jgi:hypothetical protein